MVPTNCEENTIPGTTDILEQEHNHYPRPSAEEANKLSLETFFFLQLCYVPSSHYFTALNLIKR